MKKLLKEVLRVKVNALIDAKNSKVARGVVRCSLFEHGRMCGKIEAYKYILELLDE